MSFWPGSWLNVFTMTKSLIVVASALLLAGAASAQAGEYQQVGTVFSLVFVRRCSIQIFSVWWNWLVGCYYVYQWLDLHCYKRLLLSMPAWWWWWFTDHFSWRRQPAVSNYLSHAHYHILIISPSSSTTTTANGGSETLAPGSSWIRAVVCLFLNIGKH